MRTHTDLQSIAPHLIYEIEMLYESGTRSLGAVSQAEQNCLLESFVIHARNLRSFLDSENARKDDVLAEDFFDAAEQWVKIRGEMPLILDGVHARVGKEIVHLTYDRSRRAQLPGADKEWNVFGMLRALMGLIEKFARSAPAESLAEGDRAVILLHTQLEPFLASIADAEGTTT